MTERLQSERSCSYPEFIKLVENLITKIFHNELIFVRDINTKATELEAPCLTYKLISKTPGSIGINKKEIKPRYRSSTFITETDINGEVTTKETKYFGQKFDVLVQFDLWAINNELADELELRFEQTMYQYLGYFQKNGIIDMYFDSQLKDSDAEQMRIDLKCRSLRYLVLIEQITQIKLNTIKEIDYEITVKSSLSDTSTDVDLSNKIKKI